MPNFSRRSFLRGTGRAFLSLPFLESIAGLGGSSSFPSQRLAFYYIPIGIVRRGFFPGEQKAEIPKFNGGNMKQLFEPDSKPGVHELNLTPTQLPLADLKEKITLITGLDRTFQNGTDVHAQCASCFLSSAAPFSITSSAWPLDRTLDHLVADKIGHRTPLKTLEFSCNSHRDNLESIYFDNISWYGTGHVAPSIRDPRQAYRRLFGTEEIQEIRNVTDLVLEDARSLEKELGYLDRQKFQEYFESIRAVEQQIDRMEKMKDELDRVPFDEPTEAHLPRGKYIRLMGDLMIAALQTGITNVATFMVGPERWNTPFKFEGVSDKPISHHKISHNQRQHVEQLLQIDKFYMEQFAYLVTRMDSIQEANGTTLLDNTLFTYGSGLGDGSTHQYNDLPIIVAGSGGGKIRTGKHLNCADGTPLANLWLTQANALGLELPRFADSTGLVSQLML